MDDISRGLEAQITGLKSASAEELRRHWLKLCGKNYPSHLARYLIEAILAYRLQADAFGDLSPAHKMYLAMIGRSLSKDPEAPIPRFAPECQKFKPGTVFVREHEGTEHRVMATAEGLSWGGQTYSSLSAVARAITGTNWNGRRFFGLSSPAGAE